MEASCRRWECPHVHTHTSLCGIHYWWFHLVAFSIRHTVKRLSVMLPGWGSVPSLGSFRTPRLSNKSLLIWKIGIFKIGFRCFFLPSGSQTSGIHSHQQLFDSIFNLVCSFCIVFRGLKYMEEDWGLRRRRFWTFCSPAGVSTSLVFLAPWSRW